LTSNFGIEIAISENWTSEQIFSQEKKVPKLPNSLTHLWKVFIIVNSREIKLAYYALFDPFGSGLKIQCSL